MKSNILLVLVILMSSISCSNDDEGLCYSFDERQCAADDWITIPSEQGEDQKLDALKRYLSEQGVNVKKVRIDPDFHTIVCQACEVCPSGPRYYVLIDDADESTLNDLYLLNLSPSGICP